MNNYTPHTPQHEVEEMLKRITEHVSVRLLFVNPNYKYDYKGVKNISATGSYIVDTGGLHTSRKLLFHYHPFKDEDFVREIVEIDDNDQTGYTKAVDKLGRMIAPMFEKWGHPLPTDKEDKEMINIDDILRAVNALGSMVVWG